MSKQLIDRFALFDNEARPARRFVPGRVERYAHVRVDRRGQIARRHRTILRTALPAANFDGNKRPPISGKETRRAPRRRVAI